MIRFHRCAARSNSICVPVRYASTEAGVVPAPVAPKVAPKKKRRRWPYIALFGGAVAGWRTYDHYSRTQHRRNLVRSAVEVPVPSRAQMVQDLKAREADVLVIGGGATGCGVALDATTRGLSVACIDQEDFGSGTSSKSTKLFWGGSRYLIQAAVELLSPKFFSDPREALTKFADSFIMVLSCLHERNWFVEQQQHLARWIPLAVPFDRWLLWPNPPFGFYPAIIGPISGMFPFFFKIYDMLGCFACPGSYVMSPSTGRHVFPQVSGPSGSDVKYFSVFCEAQHNDARTNVAIALTAAMRGASIANYVSADSLIFDKVGKAIGAKCVDKTTGEKFTIRAKNIIFAGGAFTDGLRKLGAGGDKVNPIVTGAGGTHIVLPSFFCPSNLGYVNMQTSDGRFLFYMPWMGHTLVGTTDCETNKPELHTAPSEDDIAYIFREMKKYLDPAIVLKRSDVQSAWYGVRPLVSLGEAGDTSAVSRDHYIDQDAKSKVWTIAGGKWTTYREMAQDVLDQMCADRQWDKASHSRDVLLMGEGGVPECSEGWHRHVGTKLMALYNVSHEVAEHLSSAYGTRAFELLKDAGEEVALLHPKFPIIEAEVRYAVRNEFAQTAVDILARRTRLAFLNVAACDESIPRVCSIMGDELKWDEKRIQREINDCKKSIATEFIGSVPR